MEVNCFQRSVCPLYWSPGPSHYWLREVQGAYLSDNCIVYWITISSLKEFHFFKFQGHPSSPIKANLKIGKCKNKYKHENINFTSWNKQHSFSYSLCQENYTFNVQHVLFFCGHLHMLCKKKVNLPGLHAVSDCHRCVPLSSGQKCFYKLLEPYGWMDRWKKGNSSTPSLRWGK